MHAQFAAEVRPIRSEEPGFQRDERRGRRGANGGGMRISGIGVEPRWNVEREYRRARAVGPFDEAGVGTFGRPLEADSEETVDDERGAGARSRGDGGATRRGKCLVRRGGVPGKVRRIARKHDNHIVVPTAQPARRHEGIATVVSGSREDDDLPAAVIRQRARDVRARAPGEFHEWRAAMRCLEHA